MALFYDDNNFRSLPSIYSTTRNKNHSDKNTLMLLSREFFVEQVTIIELDLIKRVNQEVVKFSTKKKYR